GDPERGAQRRRRPPEGGIRPRTGGARRNPSRLLQRGRTGQGYERRRGAGADELPVLPRLRRPPVRHRGLGLLAGIGTGIQRLAYRRMVRRLPGRFIPMALPVIWDAELCAEEVRRVSKKGVHALTFTENPAALGYPSFHDEYWNPLWKALVDTDTVLNVHIGSSGKLSIPATDSPPDVMITLQPMNIVSAAADLLW